MTMTLPEVCPMDKNSECKKEDCHLYHIDWRTGDENCTIGYRYTHREGKSSQSVQDNYADNVRMKLGKKIDETPEIRDPIEEENRFFKSDFNIGENAGQVEKETHDSNKTESSKVNEVEEINERVVTSDKNTTVIHSYNSNEEDDSEPEDKKFRKNIDKAMELDLPENYEKKFWK
ncbi:hypothetical protein [Methanohalobium sp.]|uniref:hypothetical protein n=1 Tax=Methanohalobium sp. TaxID=2837493 RepID=UPI0025CE6537|nr:hypothetical protein [Methanohalobium sp.]